MMVAIDVELRDIGMFSVHDRFLRISRKTPGTAKHLKRILQVAVLHMSRQTAKGEVRSGYFDPGNSQLQFNLLFLMVEKRWSFQHG